MNWQRCSQCGWDFPEPDMIKGVVVWYCKKCYDELHRWGKQSKADNAQGYNRPPAKGPAKIRLNLSCP